MAVTAVGTGPIAVETATDERPIVAHNPDNSIVDTVAGMIRNSQIDNPANCTAAMVRIPVGVPLAGVR